MRVTSVLLTLPCSLSSPSRSLGNELSTPFHSCPVPFLSETSAKRAKTLRLLDSNEKNPKGFTCHPPWASQHRLTGIS